MKAVKTALRILFKRLGYEVRKIHDFGYENALVYNQQQAVNAYYADEKLVQHYINTEVEAQLSNIKYWLNTFNINISGKKVLDAACGTGHALKLFGQLFPTAQLFGTEYTAASLQLAKQLNGKAEIVLLDIYDNWDGRTFDAIFCQLVLEHLEHPEKAVLTLWEMLESGGFLYLSVPDGRQDNFTGHIHFWSEESWLLFLRAHLPNNISLQIGLLPDTLTLFAYIRKN